MSSATTFPASLGGRMPKRVPTPVLVPPTVGRPVSRPKLVEWSPVRTRAVPHARPPVLDEALFRGALIRERKRADRSNQAFALLLLTLGDRTAAGSPVRNAVVEAMAAVRGETGILGWFSGHTQLGVLIPEVGTLDVSFPSAVEAQLRQELAARLTAAALSSVSIQLHTYAGPVNADQPEPAPVDRLLALHERNGRRRVYAALKRGLDLAGSLALLAALSPLLLIIAGLVKLTSRGPVLFRQMRVGHTAKGFPMLKFRTMHADADHGIHKQFVTGFIQSRASAAGKDEVFKITDDPRVTSIGRLLRKTSLDELPQLWNVVRGEMSLVGPRPPLAYEVEQYQPWHRRRVLEAKPGITGLWQVRGRSRTTFDDMVRLDLRYARTCSLWTDVKILLATPSAVIAGKGAC